MGKAFVEGIVGLMANEKDPHNLMLAFSILKVILVEFDIVGAQEVHPPGGSDIETLRRRILLLPYYI
jgi:hypothetical protein